MNAKENQYWKAFRKKLSQPRKERRLREGEKTIRRVAEVPQEGKGLRFGGEIK